MAERKFGTLKSDKGLLFGTVGATDKDRIMSMDCVQEMLYVGMPVYDVTVVSDHSYLNRQFGTDSKRLEFKIEGVNKTFVSHYPCFIFADTEQNKLRLQTIAEIEEEMEHLQNQKSRLIDAALADTYQKD